MTLDTAGAGGLMRSIEGGTTIYMKSPSSLAARSG